MNYLPLLLDVELLLLLTLLDKPFVSLNFEFPLERPTVPVGMGALIAFLLSEDVVVADVVDVTA